MGVISVPVQDFIRYTLDIWQLGRSDGSVAVTVTSDDLHSLL